MRNWYRDDPVKDAEDWAAREDPRPIIGECPVCGEPVRGEDDWYEKDDAYIIDEHVVHDNCLRQFLDKNGYKL